MTAAEIFTRDLKSRGIEWMATLCGHGLDPLFQAARKAGIRLVDTRNEQTASYIAESAGRLTRQPGVCAVSSGVAQVNALTGVTNAWFDQSPMLLISGSAAMSTEGLGHFQDMDQVTVARPLTKFSRSIDCAARVRQILDEALRKSTEDVPGPTHLMFPVDIQNTEVAEAALVAPSALPTSQSCAGLGVDEIAQALAKSEKPLIVAGSGVFYDRSGPAMLRFAQEQNIPIVTPIWDRGSVDQPNPVFMGVIGAATGGAPILSEADCVLLAGAVVDYRLGYLRPPAVMPEARLLPFHGAWDALAGSCSKRDCKLSKDWLAACARRRDDFRMAVERRASEASGGKMNAADVVRVIGGTLADDPVLLVDGGSIGQWAHQLLCTDRYPGHWLTCGRSGVVGWGLGGAMAARLVYPNRPVILFSGDGAFTFNVSDLEAAARQNLPFVAIVADDLGWGITRVGHVRQFGEPISSSLGPIAFDRLAESLGARGVRAETPDQLTGELRRAMSDAAVTVIHVPIVGGNPGQ
jgi:acetolactate synthase I/II/III large subunit